MKLLLLLIPLIAASALVGYFGRRRLIGFWGFFLLSLLLPPLVIGGLLLMGFSGFLISLILFSPLIVGIFLLLSAPSRRHQIETELRVAESLRRAGVRTVSLPPAPVKSRLRFDFQPTTVAPLLGAWLVTIALFAIVYWFVGAPPDTRLSAAQSAPAQSQGRGNQPSLQPAPGTAGTETRPSVPSPASQTQQTAPAPATGEEGTPKGTPEEGGTGPGATAQQPASQPEATAPLPVPITSREASLSFGEAVRMSFDAATLGDGGTLAQRNRWLPWLTSLERLLTIIILVLIVSSLTSTRLAARAPLRIDSISSTGSDAGAPPLQEVTASATVTEAVNLNEPRSALEVHR